MNFDLRDFRHPAVLLREVMASRLRRADRRLARAQLALEEAEALLSDTKRQLDATAQAMTAHGLHGLRGETHILHVNGVVRLMAEQRRGEAQCHIYREERNACERACVELRQRIQGLDRIHAEALKEHLAQQERQRWRRLDDEIITRHQWLEVRGGTSGAVEMRHAD